MTNPQKVLQNILGDKVSRNAVIVNNKLGPAKPTISTVDGEKKFVKRVTDEQLDAEDYSIASGYWVVHHGYMHDVYK